MICICFTIVILAIILLLAFYLYLTKYTPTKIQLDDRVYKDRLILVKDKLNQVKSDYDEENEDIPLSIHQLISLLNSVIARIY
jgi:hypothetical protein